MKGLTLDAGGLIALDRNDRRVILLLAAADERGLPVVVPATALAQAIRRPASQVRLARLVRDPTTVVAPLDASTATSVGLLLAATSTSDIVDAHVVVCARQRGHHVVTSDPDDIRRLDPDVELIPV